MFYSTKKTSSSFFWLIILLIAILISSFFISEFKKEVFQLFLGQISTPSSQKPTKPMSLIFVGDIMLDRGVEYMIENYGEGDYRFPFLKIADFLREADILFGNLEGPISDKGQKVGSIYSFRNAPEAINGLVFAGFDILSIANNHIFDYGREAMEDTFLRLKEAEIDYLGGGFEEKEAHSPILKNVNGTQIAFLGYTNLGLEYWAAKEDNSGIAWLDERIVGDIETAKEKADIVVVSMHFGEEYQAQPNTEQKSFAQLAIDSGADLVIGHHPHVRQPVEQYEKGFIAYSLGNFVFDQGFSEETKRGLLLKVLIKDNKIIEVIPQQIKINSYFQPELIENR